MTASKHGGLLAALAVLAGMAVQAGPAWGQPARPANEENGGPALSLQSQLGAIPLISPRAGARPVMARVVRISQLAGTEVVGEAPAISCPDTGCQQLVSLVVDNVAQRFLIDIQFVGHGAYVALQSRSAAIGAVVDFRQGKPGPIFLRGSATATMKGDLSFVAVPAASLRRLQPAVDGQTLASGNVFNRKRGPDIVLKMEIEPAKEK